jgi:hypothetical protein
MLVNKEKLSDLIYNITPYYNNYILNKRDLKPYQSIEIMWDMGGVLIDFINKESVKPHALYRMIYGKSEGSVDIDQKSYITREFQGRCVRIRKIFKEKKDIKIQLHSLKSFTSFRECMPFFDNPKYKFKTEDRKKLLDLLNSSKTPTELLKVIRKLQSKEIGIKNDRKQRLNDFENEKQIFIDFYNFCYRLVKMKNFEEATKEIDKEYYENISKNTSSLCKDGYKYFDFKVPSTATILEKEYGEMIISFISKSTPKEIRRFRKIVPAERISRLSEMLYALTDVSTFNMI